jgi:hypothetical protein
MNYARIGSLIARPFFPFAATTLLAPLAAALAVGCTEAIGDDATGKSEDAIEVLTPVFDPVVEGLTNAYAGAKINFDPVYEVYAPRYAKFGLGGSSLVNGSDMPGITSFSRSLGDSATYGNLRTQPDASLAGVVLKSYPVSSRDGAVASKAVMPTAVSHDFRMLGFCDFDGNGTADVLWRKQSTGDVVLWRTGRAPLSGEPSLIGGAGLPALPLGPAAGRGPDPVGNAYFEFLGCGRFDEQAGASAIWRKRDTGALVLWAFTADGQLDGQRSKALPAVGQEWALADVRHIAGSTEAMLWTNDQAGMVVVWHMAGNTIARGASVAMPSVAGGLARTARFYHGASTVSPESLRNPIGISMHRLQADGVSVGASVEATLSPTEYQKLL